MAKTILDGIDWFKKDRVRNFFQAEESSKHIYMIHVGIGWGYARLPVTKAVEQP